MDGGAYRVLTDIDRKIDKIASRFVELLCRRGQGIVDNEWIVKETIYTVLDDIDYIARRYPITYDEFWHVVYMIMDYGKPLMEHPDCVRLGRFYVLIKTLKALYEAYNYIYPREEYKAIIKILYEADMILRQRILSYIGYRE